MTKNQSSPVKSLKPNLIEVQFGLADDCIRACAYCNHIAKTRSIHVAWSSIMDMCYQDAIISWNVIFGKYSQQGHWKHFTERLPVPRGSRLLPFGKTLICNNLGITPLEWDDYWLKMTEIRNNYLAHFNHEAEYGELPGLQWAFQTACLYRDWLKSLLVEYKRVGYNISIDETSTNEIVTLLESQIAEVCR